MYTTIYATQAEAPPHCWVAHVGTNTSIVHVQSRRRSCAYSILHPPRVARCHRLSSRTAPTRCAQARTHARAHARTHARTRAITRACTQAHVCNHARNHAHIHACNDNARTRILFENQTRRCAQSTLSPHAKTTCVAIVCHTTPTNTITLTHNDARQ